jgi:hypothetical protein
MTATAALILAQKLAVREGGDARDHAPAAYLGVTGGEHIYRDKKNRVWSVDLVTRSCILNVGLTPAQWSHPPKR